MSTNAAFQPHKMTYDIRTMAPSTETAVKKKFVYGDRSASSRIRCTKNTAQETVWKTYPAGVFQKNAVELNSVNDAIARVRAGGATVPPKVTGYRPPVLPTYNVAWTPVTTDTLGFPFDGVILELEGSETGQYQAMIVYTYYNEILPQYLSSIYVSTDYGHSWALSIQENTSGYGNLGFSFYAISRNGQYHVFVTASYNNEHFVVISGDYGSTWTRHAIDAAIDMPTVCISNDGQTVVVGHSISFDGAITFSDLHVVSDISGGNFYTFSATMSTTAQFISIETESEIWVSSDYGHTFYPTLSVAATPEIGDGTFTGSVCMTPTGQHQYVSRQEYATDTCVLYVSHNYGATWSAVVPHDPQGQPLPPAYWTKRSISADGQEQVVATIVFNQAEYNIVRTYYSSDGGVTWTWLDQAMPPAFNAAYTPLLTDKGLINYINTTQDPYQGTVYVSPSLTGETIRIPTFSIDQPWRAITADATGVPFQGTYIVELSASATGQHVLMLVDYVVYVSHDYGRTWRATLNNVHAAGYMADLFSYMAVSRSGEHHVIVNIVDHVLHISGDYGETWRTQSYPSYIHPSVCISDDGQTMYFGNYMSIDGGERYVPIPFLGLGSGVDPATILTTSNAMSDDGVYVTSVDYHAGRIYVSTDGGASFQVVTTYLDADANVVGLPGRFTGSICMSYNGEYQYATCFNPSIFLRSTDHGATWHAVDARDESGAPMQMDYYWTKRSIDPSTQNQIICNTNAFHAYFSVDGGVNWRQLTQAYDTHGEINSLTPIMTIQSALNSWKDQIYIYP